MLNVHTYDIYDFKAYDMELIEKGKAKSVHAIPLVDNVFGGALPPVGSLCFCFCLCLRMC